MRILQVNAVDVGGGAAKVAHKLFEAYRARGHESWMAVGVKRSGDPSIFAISQAAGARGWSRQWWRIHDRLRLQPRARALKAAHTAAAIAQPRKFAHELRGVEDFDFPGTRLLLDLVPRRPDVVHIHNMHGDYFDLRVLPSLSRARPIVVTLHDPWLLTGHCAYFLDCERWQRGCGSCPYLYTYPAVRRDDTHRNWLRKRQIYQRSSLFVAAPSRWLLERAEVSILAEGIVRTRLIPNGVDVSVFQPRDKSEARARLGLPQDERLLVFSGFDAGASPYKDFETLRAAAGILGNRPARDRITFLVLGGTGERQRLGRATLRFIPYETDEVNVAAFYQSADVYVHAARPGAENHSLAVLEALACGVPVVATAVGGIPEQVISLRAAAPTRVDRMAPSNSQPTGILTPPGDPRAIADAVARLMDDDRLLQVLSSNAAKDARRRFDLARQVEEYLKWYEEIAEDCGEASNAPR